MRVAAALGLIGIIGTLALARRIEPDPSGVGTHAQVGLSPCSLYTLTGVPCPTCGMTTALAHMMRLQVLEAFHAQPFGVIVFMGALLSAGGCAATICTGRRPLDWLRSRRCRWGRWMAAAAILALLSWIYKIIVTVSW